MSTQVEDPWGGRWVVPCNQKWAELCVDLVAGRKALTLQDMQEPANTIEVQLWRRFNWKARIAKAAILGRINRDTE